MNTYDPWFTLAAVLLIDALALAVAFFTIRRSERADEARRVKRMARYAREMAEWLATSERDIRRRPERVLWW